jgi:hypothetical protein
MSQIKRRIQPAILLAVSFFLISVSISSALSVSGVILDRAVAPAEIITHELVVSLEKDEGPMNLTVEIMDWSQQLDGSNYAANESTESPFSARSFFSASPSEFHLDQGGSQKVTLTGIIPEDIGPGGKYAMFSVSSSAMPSAQDKNVGVQVAVNGLIRLTASGSLLNKSGKISHLSLIEPTSRTEQRVSIIFNNTGNVHYKIIPAAALEDRQGDILAYAGLPLTTNIIPEAARSIELSLKPERELEPGRYKISANATLEDGTLLAAEEMQFEIDSGGAHKTIK